MENSWNIQTENTRKIQRTRIAVSFFLALLGLVVIASQTLPLLKSYIDGVIAQKRVDIKVEPVPETYKTYIENEFAFYDPGQSYFANLSKQFGILGTSTTSSQGDSDTTASNIKIDQSYKKDMFINISSIGIKNIKISSNVESDDEKVYNSYLKGGVAHFKGTPLPGDGGNSFIYGHSAVESFFSRHKDYPETIFSRLENIDIGQEVIIRRDNQDLEYVVRNKKIVSPEDYSVLQPRLNKETVTLMTCWPLGIGTKRLIIVAERKI
ncbi:MAG: sortase [Candidatus Dojkabacteria bacterium]|jgi:LPXTG-site transpeptidase (sortase) family protein